MELIVILVGVAIVIGVGATALKLIVPLALSLIPSPIMYQVTQSLKASAASWVVAALFGAQTMSD